jgi:hypothetical protein
LTTGESEHGPRCLVSHLNIELSDSRIVLKHET